MNKLLFLLLTFLSVSLIHAKKNVVVHIDNSSLYHRNEVVSVPWSEIKAHCPEINETKITVTDLRTAEQVVYQLERRGQKEIQNLLIYVEVLPKGYREYEIAEGMPHKFSSKTFCRYVPERKDDFAWENNRIAFRMYGKALEGGSDNAYGIDVWTKYVDFPIIDKWYRLDDYHSDNGEGQDFYKVGLTLGAGDIAPYENGKIWYPNNYRRWEILDNGPLRSTFRLEYDVWNVNDRSVSVNKTVSIDVGSQLNKLEIEYKWEGNKPLILAAGVVKRNNPGTILLNERQGILAYWEPKYGESGEVGTACLFPTPVTMELMDKQIIGVLKLDKPGMVTYCNGAAWNKAGFITSAEEWFAYLNKVKVLSENPIRISYK